MSKLLLLVAGAASVAILASLFLSSSSSLDVEVSKQFLSFQKEFGKRYQTLEEAAYRRSIFEKNLRMITEHNARDSGFEVGLNPFADQTFEELSSRYLTKLAKSDEPSKCEKQTVKNGVNGDERKVDWAQKGKVSSVKNQGQCGSCWAFSAVGSLEAAHAIYGQDKEVQSLSTQELVDCSREYKNEGCNGGLMNFAFDYVLDHHLNLDSAYPYKGSDGKCKTSTVGEGKYGIKSCVHVEGTIAGLVDAVRRSPVSLGMYVTSLFFFYRSGVYDPWFCGGEANHGVLAVGFDLDHAKPHLRVKNSWGTVWGNKGYFQIALGKEPRGTCDIVGNGFNYYPVV